MLKETIDTAAYPSVDCGRRLVVEQTELLAMAVWSGNVDAALACLAHHVGGTGGEISSDLTLRSSVLLRPVTNGRVAAEFSFSSRAKPSASAVRSVALVSAGAGARPAISCRVKRTGSRKTVPIV